MTREELIKRVALKMDEISSSDDVIVPVGTGDNNPLYTQINNLLNESVNDALMKAPIFRIQNHRAVIEKDNISVVTILDDTRKVAVIDVPEDFIRLIGIYDRMLKRPILDLAIEGDETARRQSNKFLVAKSAKPVAVIGGGQFRTITCYSYGIGDVPNPMVAYIKRYNNDSDTHADTDLDEYMIDLVSWVCAGKVFAAQGDMNKGKLCDDNAAALMV